MVQKAFKSTDTDSPCTAHRGGGMSGWTTELLHGTTAHWDLLPTKADTLSFNDKPSVSQDESILEILLLIERSQVSGMGLLPFKANLITVTFKKHQSPLKQVTFPYSFWCFSTSEVKLLVNYVFEIL